MDIVEIQKVIHTVKIDKVKQFVDVKSSGKSADEIDKETVSFGEMQLKQEDRSCVYELIELHLHVVHVVPRRVFRTGIDLKIAQRQFVNIFISLSSKGVSTEDANQKFLRSLPSSWSQVSLVMRTKPGVDSLSFDDLYNNLRVFESDVKGSTGSSSSTQNVAFFSSESTSSTNDVSNAYGVSTSSGYNSQREKSLSYIDELMYSFFANQSSGPHLDHEDLEQLDEFDLEEMDLKWLVAMISMRLKKFYKKPGRRLQFDAKEPVGFDKTKVECFNCHNTWHFARECRSKGNQESRRRDAGNTRYRAKDNGRRPGKQEEPKDLVTLDGEGVDWAGHSEDEQENFTLMAYSNSGLNTKVTSCSKECVESYAKLKKLYDEQREQLGDASIEIQAYTQALKKKLLAEAVKEKEELKTKLENFQSSSKGLSKLLNSQMSTRDKSGLWYGDQVHNGVLSYENEVFQSVFDRPDREVDDSIFTYGSKQSKTSESDTQTSNYDFCKSNSSIETLESVPEPVVVKPKVVSQPKVWSDAPIIEEYDFSHLIRDCDFHEKRMAKHVELNKKKGKGTGQEENRLMRNNVQRLNHQNKFVPTAVLTRTGRIPVNTARHNFNNQAVSTSATRKVNAVRPIVNDVRPKIIFHKTHTPIRRPFNRTTAPRTKISNQKVNTAEIKTVSVVGGKRETAVKPSTGYNWRPKRHYWNKFSKYNSGSNSRKCDNPQRALKNKGIVDSGCSRHMTGNKAYLAEYQDYNGGLLILGGVRTTDFNLFLCPQMCDKKNMVLFTNTEGLVPMRSENHANKTVGPKRANHSIGTQDNIDAGNSEMEAD
ncbi:ribonuclease H-like domain-containing protein [Tanacetum coccineum]